MIYVNVKKHFKEQKQVALSQFPSSSLADITSSSDMDNPNW